MLQKWCQATSCNGVLDLYESKENKITFVFWSVMMVCMVVLSVWFTYRTIIGYVETPTVTNVGTISQNDFPLPELLICYEGGLNVSAMRAAKFSENLITNFSTAILYGQPPANAESQEELRWHLENKNISMNQLLHQFGYSCDEFVMSISLPVEGQSDSTRCQYAQPLIGYGGGTCAWFNNTGIQHVPDSEVGIKAVVAEPENSFYRTYPNTAIIGGMLGGFSISVERQFNRRRSTRYATVGLNVQATIVLNPTRYIRSSTSGNCDNSGLYSDSNICYFDCFIRAVKKICNCIPAKFWIEGSDIEMCNPFEIQKCMLNVTRSIVGPCIDTCVPICDEWIFQTSVTYKNLDSQYWGGSQSIVVIFYDAMQYVQIEEVAAFTIDMAIANVGGQSGLWLGASVVTVIQALYYVTMWIHVRFFGGKTKIVNKKQTPMRNNLDNSSEIRRNKTYTRPYAITQEYG